MSDINYHKKFFSKQELKMIKKWIQSCPDTICGFRSNYQHSLWANDSACWCNKDGTECGYQNFEHSREKCLQCRPYSVYCFGGNFLPMRTKVHKVSIKDMLSEKMEVK